MKFSRYLLVAALALLSACSSSHRPVYSGHQENTDGVPGFVNGKKTSPYVKLGQSYSVDGEEYVPRNQPDYVEEGMASWYGPGFHGGKTANGERFDSNALTGAHRTLPLPSIVRVTLLSTGKSAIVRINDRGPFAHSRIIDLSHGAAEKIGLLGVGVGKVRIEYMPKESQRFADLLSQGREPDSIDLASDVLEYSDSSQHYAQNNSGNAASTHSGSFWDNMSGGEPTPEAAIESLKTPPVLNATNSAAPLSNIASNDLADPSMPPASLPKSAANTAQSAASPFEMLSSGAGTPMPTGTIQTASAVPSIAANSAATNGSYVQLGAFSNAANAERMALKYKDIGNVQVFEKTNGAGQTLFHVRMGPYSSSEASNAARDKLTAAGADAKIVRD